MRGPIAQNTFRTSLVLALRLFVQAGTLLLVARLLGPGQFGAFAGVTALAVMLGGLASWGSHLLLLREMSRELQRGAIVLPQALGGTVVCGTLLFALFLAASHLLPASQLTLPVLMAIGAAELWLQPILVLASIDWQARGRIATSQLLLTLPLALRCIAAWIIWLHAPADPLRVYAIAHLGAVLLAVFVGVRKLSGRWPPISRWRLPRREEWRDASGFAVLNITAMGPTELDKTLAVRLLTLPAAGVYAAGARVVGALSLPVIALMLSALPKLFATSSGKDGRKLLRAVFGASAAYGVLASAFLLAGAGLLELLFGHAYAGIGTVLHWLALAVPGMGLRIAAGNTLMAANTPWLRAGTELLGLATLCAAAWILAPSHQVSGMPLALACSEWSMATVGWWLLFGKKE